MKKYYCLTYFGNILAVAPMKEYFDVFMNQRNKFKNKKGFSVKRLHKEEVVYYEEFILHIDYSSGYLLTNVELLEVESFRRESKVEVEKIIAAFDKMIQNAKKQKDVNFLKKIKRKIVKKKKKFSDGQRIIEKFLNMTPEETIIENKIYGDYRFGIENFD